MTERHRHLIEAARRQVDDAHAAATSHHAAADIVSGGVAPLESIPGYRVEHVVHRGGQGTVYRAIQASTSRTVALKVMRDRPFHSVADRARFDREVEILGELDHPSIVRIVDSGHADGRDFLAMDFVDGVPLDRAAYGDPRRALHLLAEVCDAVHAAHLRGVIHRDLKPGNILVDAAGRPRVLDFGLAKRFEVDGAAASADSVMTETGQILGSLPWASPEQAAGDLARIDVRSDVYALGVVLYQLLTRSFPYRVAGPVREVLDAIVSDEPVPPSRIDPQVDDELETIVLRTLSKEPSRRYQSAGDLARDIRHYLAGELIEAKRDSLPYVVRKQLRRHWLPVCALAAVVLAIFVGAVVAASQWRRAVDERDLKESQRRRAEAVGAVLHDILASASPRVSRGERVAVADVLDDAVAGLDAGSLAADPDVEAAIRQTLGESYLGLGQLDAAARQLEASLALNERVHGRDHPETARSLAALGRLARTRGDPSASAARLEEALAILEAAPGSAGDEIPTVMLDLAGALSELDDRDRVEMLHRDALAQAIDRFGAGDPRTARVRLAIETHRLGGVRGVELLREELRLNRETLGPRHPETLRTLIRLADELHVKGQPQEAEATYLQAIELGRQVYGDNHPDVLRAVTSLHWLYEHAGRHGDAARLLREWEPAARTTYGARSARFAEYLMVLGGSVGRTEDAAEGEQTMREALTILTELDQDRGWRGAECRMQLSRFAIDRGDDAEAARLAQEVLALENDDADRIGLRQGQAHLLLGEVLVHRADFPEAEDHLLQAYAALAPRRSMPGLAQRAAQQLLQLYETWSAAEANAERAAKVAEWRERTGSRD